MEKITTEQSVISLLFTDFKDIKYSCPKCYEGYLVS